MKLSIKKIVQKIITSILILITLFSSLPISQIFAWTSGEGQTATSMVGENYVGMDGKEYYFTKGTDGIKYDENGNITEVIIYRDRPLEKFYLVRNGEKVNAFCIEAVTKFENGTYKSVNYNNSSYFNNLPYVAKYGIMLATVYGWRKDLPKELQGKCNMDDYLYAVQLIIWEYQQQIRTSPTSISSKHDIPADVYSHSIKGRPAEIAYNWILKQMSNHTTIPSFSSSAISSAKTYTLKYNSDTKKYSLTLTDTKNTLADIKFDTSSGISVSRSGNKYTFTSTKMITDAITITAKKDINKNTDSMLVWGRGGYQTMATGVNDPVSFYLKINTETYGKAHLVKKSEDLVVEGVKLRIEGNGVDKTVLTGKDGTVDVENLLPGTYQVTEETEDKYVEQPTQTVTIRSGQTSTVTFTNVLKKFRVTVTKSDKETGTTEQGDGTVKGAKYGLFNGEELVDTYITDSNGQFTTKYYLCGDNWTIRELSASEGYLVDPTVYEVGAEPELYRLEYNSLNKEVKEKIVKGKISIIKHTDDGNTQIETPEVGSEFEVYLKKAGSYANAKETERDILTCDEDGFAETKLLPYGVYVVHQTYGWDNREFIQDFEVYISENEKTYRYLINNKEFESYLKMVKVDAKTGKRVTFSNTSFMLSKLNDNSEWEKVKCKVGNEYHDTWTTNSKGEVYTETKLRSGTYKLEEIKVPEGFLQLDEELIFEINMSNRTIEYDDDYDAYITVEARNEQPSCSLIVDKSVAIREDVDTSIINISDLSGIKFRLTAKENIIDYSDGSIIYEEGQEIGIYNLDKKGKLKVDNLPMGKYQLEEIETLPGLVLDNTKHDIVFTQEDTIKKVYTETREIENNTTLVEFSKTDITGDKELIGAKLTVLDEDENIIDSWISTANTHKIEGLKVGKTYIMREEITPDNYVQATDIRFKVENTNEIQKVTMIDKLVAVKKTDFITGNEVEGAELVLTDKDENIVDEWISGKEEHYVSGLVEGETYTLTEKSSPYGYEISESITFTVTNDKETQIIEMKDMPILKTIRIVKADSETKEIIKSRFKFGIYEDYECTKLIKEVKSDKKFGTVTFENLRYGIYFIKELEAPKRISIIK